MEETINAKKQLKISYLIYCILQKYMSENRVEQLI